MPSLAGLHASQIIEPARILSQRGHEVHWVAIVPIFSFLKNWTENKEQLLGVARCCGELKIKFSYMMALWNFNGVISFLFRKIFLKQAARKLSKKFRPEAGKVVIIHGRSYYAAQIGIYLKKFIGLDERIIASFDMRSLAPEEMPLTRGVIGYMYYGLYKKWEYEIISCSDVSFLPLKYACEQIKIATGRDITFAPIQGFDRDAAYAVDFESRWRDRLGGYAGSFGKYQDPGLLKEMLCQINGAKSLFATAPNASLRDCNCISLPFSEMENYYKKLLFLIIPGRRGGGEYFQVLKMRCNFFSTKAAEALSVGVPLFVSSELAELASFVKENECGVVYDPQVRQIVHPEGQNMLDEDFWRKITRNAFSVGEMFTRRKVLEIYENGWEKMIQ